MQQYSSRGRMQLYVALFYLVVGTGLAAARPVRPHFVNNNKQGTLVILVGQGRGNELTWQSLRRNVLRPLHADLATMFTEEWRSSPLVREARYSWWIPEFKNWGVMLEAIGHTCGLENVAWQSLLCKVNGGRFLYGVLQCSKPVVVIEPGERQNLLHSGRATAALLSLRHVLGHEIKRNGLLARYDWFMITRSDHVYLCEHISPKFLSSQNIWVPTGEHYGGWTDRHAVVSSKNVLQSLDVASKLICNAGRLQSMLDGTNANIEVMLKLAWSEMQLNVSEFDRNMFTVRSQSDTTSWSVGLFDADLEPYCSKVKYPSAKAAAERTCASRVTTIFNTQTALRDIARQWKGCAT